VDPRELAIAQARARIAVGITMLLAPALAGRVWLGREAARPATKLIIRGFGGRDLALGLGVVIALDRGAPVRGWLEGSALADVGDLVATLLAGDAIPAVGRNGMAVLAGGSAVAAFALSRVLDEPSEPVHAPEATLTGHPAQVGA
jgi:peptide-methionine (R)-S-oxide reductase